jgi:hypothetical protein
MDNYFDVPLDRESNGTVTLAEHDAVLRWSALRF